MVLKSHFLAKRLRSTKSYFVKAIDHTFYGFTGVITHVGRTLEKLVDHSPSARDLQAFLVLCQHPEWVITLINP